MKLLAIETSFDDTCMALLNSYKLVKHHKVSFTNKGLIPIEGQEHHKHQLKELIQHYPSSSYDAIACTRGPGQGLCLKEGWGFANDLALKYNKPLMGIHHMEAHCLSSQMKPLDYPYVCFVGSGGHTQMVKVYSPTQFQLLSNCLDDAIGEAYDKISRLFGLSTPKMCSLLYGRTSNHRINIMEKDKTGNFSFAGLKSAIRRLKDQRMYSDLELMTIFQTSALNHIKRQIIKVLENQQGLKGLAAVGGAVMNRSIQDLIHEIGVQYQLPIAIPEPLLLTDNAIMIGLAAQLQINESRPFDKLDKWYFAKWDYNRIAP